MAEESVVTQEMHDSVGVEGPASEMEVDKTSVRMFARSVGHTDPVFFDEEEAKKRGYRSLLAPPGYLGTRVFNPAAGPEGAGRRASPYKRNLNGGTEIEYYADICAGDRLTARSKIVSYEETRGRLGPMLVTRTETNYTNQDGKVVAVSRGTGLSY